MSLQVAKVKGIPVKLHFTLAIVFALITWTLAVSYMPLFYPGLPQSAYWTMGIFGAITLFISVLLHELSHSIVANRFGYKVRQIILFVFGGVSDIRDEPKEEYKKEFTIAIVGPISSFALAGLFAVVWFVLIQTGITSIGQTDASLFAFPTSSEQQEQVQRLPPSMISDEEVALTIAQGVMRYGVIVNILLGGFNLLPAFPLDGGRVLRAGLMRWRGNYHEATKIAVKVGIGVSYGLMAFGFLTIFTGSFTGGIWLILIAWFLQSGAQSYLQQHEITTVLSGVRLYQIMNTEFVAASPSMSIKQVLEDYFNIHRKSELPVVEKEFDSTTGDNNNNNNNNYYYLLGSVSAKDAVRVTEKDRESIKVEDIMVGKKNLVIMSPEKTADVALNTIMEGNKSRIYVCENPSSEKSSSSKRTEKMQQQMTMTYSTAKPDRLVGIVSKTDILNVAKERMEYTETMKRKTWIPKV
ncbi:MAG TPA: site-2 protease family protein [Nitrososphaera sp.]|nr:site-2 protease family protein [Nitrososphaera sp.]